MGSTTRTVTVNGKASMGPLNAAVKNSGKATREFNAELKKAILLQQQFEMAQGKAAKANAEVASQMAKAKKSTEDARLATSKHAMMVGGALVAAFGAAEYATLGFDKQMSAVGAASGATGKDLAGLRDAAIAAGQATVFGAQDAARAEEELAKAGVSVKDVLSGGLIGSLNLATAGSLDLGRAAEIAASTMTQFKLAGKDIPHIADLLAAGAGKAQGSVEDLGLAMKYVGPTASQMGVSLEETTGTLAELASNGIMADSAGTGLRGVLTALTGPSAKAAGTMKDLGINVYDAHGKFVGFRGVAEQLHRSLSGLSAQQRDVALAAIFGNEQISVARILYAGGAQAVDDWTAKVNDSGYAARFAAARMDNLAGDLEQLKGSLETALIKGGTGATGVLRGLAQAATGAVNAFSDLPGPVQTGVSATLALVGGTLLAAGAYGTFVPKLRTARQEMEKAGKAGMAASRGIGMLGNLGVAVAGIGAVYEGLHALSNQFDKLTGHAASSPEVIAQHYADLFVEIAAGRKPVRELSDEFVLYAQAAEDGGMGSKLAREGFADLDKQMSEFARGDPKNAAKIMATLTDALGAQGFTAQQVAAKFPQYAAALEATRAQAVLTGQATDDMGTSIQDAGGKVVTYTSFMVGGKMSTDNLAEATGKLSGAVKELTDEYDFYIGRHVDLVKADSDWRQALMAAEKQLKDSKGSLDDWTDAGEKNIQLFGSLFDQAERHAEAMVKDSASADEATAAFWRQIDSIRNLGIRSGISTTDMDTLLGRMLKVGAAKVKPTIDANIRQAMANISAVARALAALNGKIAKTYLYNFTENITTAKSGGKIGYERGTGDVSAPWPAAGPGDTVGPLWLAPHEGVLRRRAVDALGGPRAVDALNAGRALPAAAVAAGPAAAGGGGTVRLDPSDRALLRSVVALADRPIDVRAVISEREVYDANRRQTLRNARR
jgi:TP901 family phage tail tape measure protein